MKYRRVVFRSTGGGVTRIWSHHVAYLVPDPPGEQPASAPAGLLKLNTNENPYGPSPRVIEAIRAAADDTLRLYPDYAALPLREAIADMHGLDAGQVFVGNGSDEVLDPVFDSLFRQPGRRSEETRVGKGCVSTCRFRWWPCH